MKTTQYNQTEPMGALSKLRALSPSRHILSFGLSLAIASSLSSQSDAAVLPASGTNGDVVVDAGTDGPHTYVLDGHGIFPGPYTADFLSTTVLTGDPGESEVVRVTDPGYTITNWGQITGGATQNGVTSTADILSGIMNMDGATISGGEHGIAAFVNNISVTNFGIIQGDSEEGIDAGDGSTIINGAVFNPIGPTDTGSISSLTTNGITVGDGASVTNNWGSTITGGGSDGINAGDGFTLVNDGTITGTLDDGVDVLDNANITNNASGRIVGEYGVYAQENLMLVNRGVILANSFDGVRVEGDGASITNHLGAQITGGEYGVYFDGVSGTVTNNGTITGTDIAGIFGDGSGAVVVNNNAGALITGDTGISLSGNSEDTVNSSGTITGTGGDAIKMGNGDDTTNLNDGSVVNGDVDGQGGTDELTYSGTNTTNGDVTDFENVTKTGGGFSLVNGRQEAEDLDVDSGQLTIRDGLRGTTGGGSSVDTIDVGGAGSSAELGGGGVFRSDVTNINSLGIFSPGMRPLSVDSSMAVGELRHNGELNFNVGSVNRVDFNPVTTTHDLINQDGELTISVGSALHVGPTSVNAPIQDGTYEVINQLGGSADTSGDFGTVAFNLDGTVVSVGEFDTVYNVTNTGFFNSSTVTIDTFQDGFGDIQLTVAHDYTAPMGLTPNGTAFGAYLNTLLDDAPGNADLADFLAFLDYSDEDLVAAVMNQFDPSFHVAVSDIAFHSGHSLNRAVENHLALVRNQGSGTTTTVTGDPKSGPVVVDVPTHSWNVWGTASGESIDVTREHFVTNNGLELDSVDLDGDALNFTAGADYRVSNDLVIGIFGQVSSTDLDDDSYTDIEADSYFVGLYGTWGGSEGLFVDGLIGFGNHDFDTERSMFAGRAEASYDADGFIAMLGAGYMMGESGSCQWGPVASLEYQKLDVDAFTESVSNLAVHDRDIESLRGLIGVKATGSSGGFNWHGSVRYAHDFTADDDRDITAGFIGLPGSFTATGGERGDSSLILNAGINKDLTDSINVGISYFGEIALDDEGLDSHGGALEVNIAF